MKKTRKQKNLEWQHIYANPFKQEYLLKTLPNRKSCQRFKMVRLIKTVKSIKRELFSGPLYVMSNGVGYDSRTRKVSILRSFN